MRKFFGLFLIAPLLLSGCAKKLALDAPPAPAAPPVAIQKASPAEVPPAPPLVVKEIPPEPAPASAAPAEVPVVPVQKAAPAPAAMKVFFDFDSALLSPESKEVLQANSLWLQAQPEVRVLIEGHTDERGSSSYNLALGEKRAQAARDYLVNLGITPKRISIISYGKEKAATAANDEAVWARDRRAEIVKTN